MALEVSILASAERLQTQRDRRVELALSRQREEAVQRAREAERFIDERRRADASAADIDRARVQREFVRGIADANLVDNLIARDIEDARIDTRLAREESDLRQLLADERLRDIDRDAADNALAPLTPTAPPAPTIDDVPAPPSVGQNSFEELLAERNARLSDRADADRQFIATQTRDFNQSVRSIEDLQTNPTAIPADPPRGSVVDFSA